MFFVQRFSMALLTNSCLADSITLLLGFVTIFTVWIKWSHIYWQRKGLFTPPTTFFFGNSKKLFIQKQSLGDFTLDMYRYLKSHHKPHGGFYLLFMPTYMPVDPELVKHVMQNDFNHFVGRGIDYNEETDPLSAHLFSLEGAKWRNLRAKMTPTFTSAKMKIMFDTSVKCGDQLVTEMNKTVLNTSIDIKDVLARFTTDIIGTVAFGIDCNSLENPDNEFNTYIKLFFLDGFWEHIVYTITFVTPGIAKKFGLKVVKPLISNFFMRVVKDTVEYREKNNIHKKDFMHLLLQLKNRGNLNEDGAILKKIEDDKESALSINELAAQVFIFFLAGFETSSTTMTFCLFELSSNPEIQEKLRQEVFDVLKRHDNKLTYDATIEMHYMEKVINETLRKYPPITELNRICTKDYKVPGSNIVIKKNTKVWIPVLGLHRDPEFYPDPEKFDPERFSEENKNQRHPYTFIPFGEGPRVCMGLRFGMMQIKVGLSILLNNYKFSVSPKTTVPLQMDPKNFMMSTEGGIWLDYAKV